MARLSSSVPPTAVYFVKYVAEKMGKFDSKGFINVAHGRVAVR